MTRPSGRVTHSNMKKQVNKCECGQQAIKRVSLPDGYGLYLCRECLSIFRQEAKTVGLKTLKITYQETEWFHKEAVPKEYLRELATELVETSLTKPDFKSVTLKHKWAGVNFFMILRQLDDGSYHVLFAVPDDMPGEEHND